MALIEKLAVKAEYSDSRQGLVSRGARRDVWCINDYGALTVDLDSIIGHRVSTLNFTRPKGARKCLEALNTKSNVGASAPKSVVRSGTVTTNRTRNS